MQGAKAGQALANDRVVCLSCREGGNIHGRIEPKASDGKGDFAELCGETRARERASGRQSGPKPRENHSVTSGDISLHFTI